MALMVHVTSLVSAKMPTASGMAVLGLLSWRGSVSVRGRVAYLAQEGRT